MKRKTLLVSGGVAIGLLALLAWAFAPRPQPVETAEARTGPFETTINEDGRTRLADRFVVSAPLAGRLERLALREGDAVAAGDTVAVLRPVLAPLLDERTRSELASRVGAAEASLQRAGTRIEAARIALERARVDLARTQQLAQQGFVAPIKIDADRLAAAAAQKELDTAVESEHVSRHELDQARAALSAVGASPRAPGAGAAAGGRVFELKSPVLGRVLKLHQQSETVVTLGAPIVEVGDLARLEIVADLLTTDAVQARPGSVVRIEQWGGPGTLAGRVRRVEPAGFTKVSALGVEEQRVRVVFDFASPREQWAALGDGYRVSLAIVTQAVPDALQVPVSAVFPLPTSAAASAAATPVAGGASGTAGAAGVARHAVFVVADGRVHLRAVRLVARNGRQAWLAEGLKAGETVVVYPPASLVDGVRVRPRATS